MSLFKAETPPPIVPQLVDISEAYKSTTATIKKLEVEVVADQNDFFALKTNANDDTSTASRVEAIVNGTTETSPNPVLERQRRMDAIQLRVPDKLDAIHILRQKAAKERVEASREITNGLKGHDARLRKEIIEGLVRIHAAMVEMRTFSNALAANDIISNGLFVAPDFLPNAHDTGSALADYFREAVQLGFLRKLPAELIHKPYSTESLPANGALCGWLERTVYDERAPVRHQGQRQRTRHDD